MKYISLLSLFIVLLFSSCDTRMESADLIDELQQQVDTVMSKGFDIAEVDISSKDYGYDGPDKVGYFKIMKISAVSPDTTIKYMAEYIYSEGGRFAELSFRGYPTNPKNGVTGKSYDYRPDLPAAIARLDEIKEQIPEKYTYKSLLGLRYAVENGLPVYSFEIELKPESDDTSHPDVWQYNVSHVSVSRTRTRRRTGVTQEVSSVSSEKDVQHIITFRLKEDRIEIEKR
ncbi:hypothetical protein [Dysgonomonas sp. 25]|uniref:hypothetical protein n=1 Tax=Dysgonomonas sp. 25 TaxID=2302933 RepID=UPI0013D8693B|nr:hypothetical protein [Dysgonomonas sp. 25]NDV68009.1 hypothetical protein [Dysgonomonas sp. 25]